MKTPTEKAKCSPGGSLSKDRDGQGNVPPIPHVSENSKWTHAVSDLFAELGRFDRHFLAVIGN